MPVVRLSRGSFPSEKYDIIRTKLGDAEKSLIPAIRQLKGCLYYFAGIDHASNAMINVSVWQSLPDARQMESLVSSFRLRDRLECGSQCLGTPSPIIVRSRLLRAQSSLSYDGIEHPENPIAARRSWPRWSSIASGSLAPQQARLRGSSGLLLSASRQGDAPPPTRARSSPVAQGGHRRPVRRCSP